MNKRFVLALLLTGAVFILTPILFPGSRRLAPPITVTSADTTGPALAAPVTAVPNSVAAPARQPGGGQPVAVAAETTLVSTGKARLRLSNFGGALIGAVSFSGSLVAFGKLQELIPSSIKGLANQNLINFFSRVCLRQLGCQKIVA